MWFVITFIKEVLGCYEMEESINLAIANSEMVFNYG